VLASARRHPDERQAQRALLQATEDLTLCFTAAWERLRQEGTTAEQLFLELQKALFLLQEARDRLEILVARLAKLAARSRPHYSPELRFRILEHMRKYMLSAQETARRFLVTPQTIYNWLDELRQDPAATTIGSTVVPVPPVRRFSQAFRRLIRQMKEVGFGGRKKIAETLLRSSWRISIRSVGRIVKEKPIAPPPAPQAPTPRSSPTTVRGNYPNHLWLVDITRIPTLFPMLSLHLVVILDAFSRLPLAATIRLGEPAADVAIALVEHAIGTHARPRHLVTDQGAQFTAPDFRAFVRSQGIRIRYGRVGESHSLGLIDRFFRTLKDSLNLRSIRPWNLRDFKRRLTAALIHYAHLRPHTSLGGFTPIETYYGIRGHLPLPVSPPRGKVGDPESDVSLDFVFLDPENRAFPLLIDKAA
jgi:transposase InsO family protein/septum formation topological specificity factor MinE